MKTQIILRAFFFTTIFFFLSSNNSKHFSDATTTQSTPNAKNINMQKSGLIIVQKEVFEQAAKMPGLFTFKQKAVCPACGNLFKKTKKENFDFRMDDENQFHKLNIERNKKNRISEIRKAVAKTIRKFLITICTFCIALF